MEEVNSSQILHPEQPDIVEVTLAEFDEMVRQKKLLDELIESEAFQEIIMKGYIADDTERLAGLLKNETQNVKVKQDRDIIVEKIYAKGYLENWLQAMVNRTAGIDNPEQRTQLVKELEQMREEEEKALAEQELQNEAS